MLFLLETDSKNEIVEPNTEKSFLSFFSGRESTVMAEEILVGVESEQLGVVKIV